MNINLEKNLRVPIAEDKSPTSRPGPQMYLKVKLFGLVENILQYVTII